ncbi:unnamed protein product [Symbiodinium natans]|uniref:Uncharacterized protein n=1 Tax=Symbiodinium natans TaxID=878477 RepID=A0A812GWJ3_9DINO|nr:unnamed protein product [Symbiodinium natans]
MLSVLFGCASRKQSCLLVGTVAESPTDSQRELFRPSAAQIPASCPMSISLMRCVIGLLLGTAAGTPTEECQQEASQLLQRTVSKTMLERRMGDSDAAHAVTNAVTVEQVLDYFFADVNLLGSRIPAAIKQDNTWAECTQVDWTEHSGQGVKEVIKAMEEELGVDAFCAENPKDDTCKAINAAIRTSWELVHRYELAPKFTSVAVTDWGEYPSWVAGSVGDVDREVEPPQAEVLDGKGLVGYSMCSILRTVLTGSPNQLGSGTCGWVASLGALSWAAPAQAIKMGVRLFWTGRILERLEPCPNIYTLQPGLVELERNGDPTAPGCFQQCDPQDYTPRLSAGLTGMWTYATMSHLKEFLEDCPEPSAINVMYSGIKEKDPETFERWDKIEGQSDEVTMAMCRSLISEKCRTEELSSTASRAAALQEACDIVSSNGVALLSVDADPLQKASESASQPGINNSGEIFTGPVGAEANHVVYLQACEDDRDSYALWTWGGVKYVTKENLVGDTENHTFFQAFVADEVQIFDD